MKKYLTEILFAGILLLNTVTIAQTNHRSDLARNGASTFPETISNIEDKSILVEELRHTNPRVYRDLQSLQNVESVYVSKTEEGMSIFCVVNKINTRLIYNRGGRRSYVIRYYEEDKLPQDVRHLVRSNYYDYKIAGITEVSKNSNTAYVVSLQDSKSWLIIKVLNNELSIINQLAKTNP